VDNDQLYLWFLDSSVKDIEQLVELASKKPLDRDVTSSFGIYRAVLKNSADLSKIGDKFTLARIGYAVLEDFLDNNRFIGQLLIAQVKPKKQKNAPSVSGKEFRSYAAVNESLTPLRELSDLFVPASSKNLVINVPKNSKNRFGYFGWPAFVDQFFGGAYQCIPINRENYIFYMQSTNNRFETRSVTRA
jgi:hypothetical protein